MNEILALKQELSKGNFDSAYDLVEQIEVMTRQDRINQLENYLALIIARVIALTVNKSAAYPIVDSLRDYLIDIKQHNRLGSGFYIQEDEWNSHYQKSLPMGILKAVDTGLLPTEMGISKLNETVNFKILQIEVLGLIDLSLSLNACEFQDYLRNRFESDRLEKK